MKKQIALLLSFLMMALLLASCAGNGDSTTPAESAGQGQTPAPSETNGGPAEPEEKALAGTEVTMWYMPLYEGFDEYITNDLAAAVKEKYGITLKTEVLTWDAGPEKVTVAMATGATPDIYLDGYTRIAPGVGGNLTVDLSDVAEALAPSFYENSFSSGLRGDEIHYIPINSNTGYNITVNTTLARELGVYDLLPEDKIHWSYDEFLEFCRETVKAGSGDGIYATQLFSGSKSSDSVYYSFIMSAGSDILNGEHTAMAVNNDNARAALELFKTLQEEKLIPDGAATTVDNDIRPNWYSGKLMLMPVSTGIGEVTKVQQEIESGEIEPFEVDIYEIPTPDGKADPRVLSWGSTGFAVFNSGDEDKIAASKLVIESFLSDTGLNETICINTGNASVLKDLEIDFGDAEINAMMQRASEATALYADAEMGILESWWSDFREVFYVEFQAYLTGEKTVEEMLADWETAGNAVIEKALQS